MKSLPTRIKAADLRRARPPEKTVDPYYLGAQHKAWRAEVVRRSGGRCQDPAHDPRTPRAGVRLFADHIIERKDGGADIDTANGMARCGACHTRKTGSERMKRMKG